MVLLLSCGVKVNWVWGKVSWEAQLVYWFNCGG